MSEELRSENNKIEAYEMIIDEIKNGDAFEYVHQLLKAEGMIELEIMFEIAISSIKAQTLETPPLKDPSKQSLHIGDSV
tara:strand:- start:33 stop:269 length:237 start_codon:yes stop_codon:yes gene_type:complete